MDYIPVIKIYAEGYFLQKISIGDSVVGYARSGYQEDVRQEVEEALASLLSEKLGFLSRTQVEAEDF